MELKYEILQHARYGEEKFKHPAVIVINGVRFFSVTPGSDDEADKINIALVP